jgi:hypothetical protein
MEMFKSKHRKGEKKVVPFKARNCADEEMKQRLRQRSATMDARVEWKGETGNVADSPSGKN